MPKSKEEFFTIIVDDVKTYGSEGETKAKNSGIEFKVYDQGYYQTYRDRGFVKLWTKSHKDGIKLRNAIGVVYAGLGSGIYRYVIDSEEFGRNDILEALTKKASELGLSESMAKRAYRILRYNQLFETFDAHGDFEAFAYKLSHTKDCGEKCLLLIMSTFESNGRDDLLKILDELEESRQFKSQLAHRTRLLLLRSSTLRKLTKDEKVGDKAYRKIALNYKGCGWATANVLLEIRRLYFERRGYLMEPITDPNTYIKIRYEEAKNKNPWPWNRNYQPPFTKALCQDGYSVSIQASSGHYCLPKMNNAKHYDAFELGYPSEFDEIVEGYREESIYPFVPADIVEKLLQKHGGIVFWNED